MANKKLQIVCQEIGVNCNVRYANLAKAEKPKIIAKAPDGTVVAERQMYQGKLLSGTNKAWADENGRIYDKGTLTFWDAEGDQVPEKEITKVFEIVGFQPVSNYTDRYVIEKYYEVIPDNNGMKKQFQQEQATRGNLLQMRKLWDHLHQNQVVGRGEFNVSSKGFLNSDGYIRAIKINGNKWGLEIGVFSQEKIFEHLNEGVPEQVNLAPPMTKAKKLKLV